MKNVIFSLSLVILLTSMPITASQPNQQRSLLPVLGIIGGVAATCTGLMLWHKAEVKKAQLKLALDYERNQRVTDHEFYRDNPNSEALMQKWKFTHSEAVSRARVDFPSIDLELKKLQNSIKSMPDNIADYYDSSDSDSDDEDQIVGKPAKMKTKNEMDALKIKAHLKSVSPLKYPLITLTGASVTALSVLLAKK